MTQPISRNDGPSDANQSYLDDDESLSCSDPNGPVQATPADAPTEVNSTPLDAESLLCDDTSRATSELALPRQSNSSAFVQAQEQSTPEPVGYTNAERTAARRADSYLEAGMTPETDVAFGGGAFLKGRFDGGQIEVGSASAQVGTQNEVQMGSWRVTADHTAGLPFGFEVEVHGPEVEGHAGSLNSDGSEGINVGGGVSWGSAELRFESGGNSVSVGGNYGGGFDISMGVRDLDGDGRIEFCARGALQVSVGACVEPETARELADEAVDRFRALVD